MWDADPCKTGSDRGSRHPWHEATVGSLVTVASWCTPRGSKKFEASRLWTINLQLKLTDNRGTMNLLLSDDYLLQDYPEHITNTIRSGHSTCVRFNRKGDYLASGRVDGTVVIWDLETMGVARKLRGHSKNISSLSWSRCGRYLLSACQGWKAILWDLQDGKRYREVRFRAPVYGAELHPWNP